MATPSSHPSQEPLGRCPLLSLPTELRLKIYHYLLISDQYPPTLWIRRGYMPAPFPDPPDTPPASTSRFIPILETNISPTRRIPLATSLLYTCKDIYNEFLPLLYATITFSPIGMFDAFLARLLPFATAQIRTVRLLMERFHHEPEEGVAWPVLCAQVKSLVGVKRVEVVYRWGGDSREKVVRSLMRELVGMRGVVFVGVEDKEEEMLIRLLGEVEREVAAEKKMRRDGTDAAVHDNASKSRDEPPVYCPLSTMALQAHRGVHQVS
jgi:hypothetical protein